MFPCRLLLSAAVLLLLHAQRLIALPSTHNLALLLLVLLLPPPHPHAGLPASMSREVQSVFPGVDLTGMLVVPTCQQADYDLVRTGEKIEGEKDRLLERVSVLGCCWLVLGSVAQGVDTYMAAQPTAACCRVCGGSLCV